MLVVLRSEAAPGSRASAVDDHLVFLTYTKSHVEEV